MNTNIRQDIENTHWYLRGFGAGERHRDNGKILPPVITPPKQANECYVQGFKDAFEN